MVNRRPMITLLIRNHELAALGAITFAPGRTSRIQNRHAVLDQRHFLRRKRDFDPQLFWIRAATKKNLRGLPMPELSREIKRDHLVTAGATIFFRAGLQ